MPVFFLSPSSLPFFLTPSSPLSVPINLVPSFFPGSFIPTNAAPPLQPTPSRPRPSGYPLPLPLPRPRPRPLHLFLLLLSLLLQLHAAYPPGLYT
eukprot:768499-Hanusia_phi.AAC.4